MFGSAPGSRGGFFFVERFSLGLPCRVGLDLKLPKGLGLDVLRWIRRQPALKAFMVIVFASPIAAVDNARMHFRKNILTIR
jgi:hypothetical protein